MPLYLNMKDKQIFIIVIQEIIQMVKKNVAYIFRENHNLIRKANIYSPKIKINVSNFSVPSSEWLKIDILAETTAKVNKSAWSITSVYMQYAGKVRKCHI